MALLAAALAILSIWSGRQHSRKAKMIWTVVVVLIPVIGPAGWFALGRERRRP